MFAPVRYRFDLYAHVEGPAASFQRLRQSMEPPMIALATCYDATVRLYIRVNGVVVTEESIDWTDGQLLAYQLHVVYSGSELSRQLATQIRGAVDLFRRYYGLLWHRKRIETLLTR